MIPIQKLFPLSFMETNEKKIDDVEEELEDIEEVQDDQGNDITDWKGLAQSNFGRAKRFKTKAERYKTDFETYKTAHPEVKEPDKSQDKKEFDLAEKSYLLSNGIKKDEFQLVFDEVQKSGKTIDEVLESKYFQEGLEEKRSEAATPAAGKRATGAAKDEVDYWISKGEYPPNTPDNRELRRKVANALAAKASNKQKFSENPIA